MAASDAERVDGAYRALRIGWRTRLRLWWYARSDRRAGLPVGLTVETTPVLSDLVAQFGEACERERTAYLTDVEPLDTRLGQLEAELEALAETLAVRRREAERLSAPPEESRLAVRYPGEEWLADTATRERRALPYRRAAEAARAALEETRERLHAALAEQAELAARKQARADLARSHVVRLRESTHRQAAVYRRALVRGHRQSDELVSRWTTELCTLPGWAAAEPAMPTPAPSGASA